MKQTIDIYQFRNAFSDYNRQNNFTYEGLTALFHWFEELEEDMGAETELDVVAICCDFTEYENLKELQANYGAEGVENYPDMEDIENATVVIPVDDNSFIIQNF